MNNLKLIRSVKIAVFLLMLCGFHTAIVDCQSDSLLIKTEDINKSGTGFETERFSASTGLFSSLDNAGITLVSKQLGLGVIIDLEDALGLETSTFVFRGTLGLRFGKGRHNEVVLDYFSINRRAIKILQADLEIGDKIYVVGTKLASKFNVSIIRVKYEYSFVHDDRISLGFSAGLFIMPIRFSVKTDSSAEQSTSIVAPLPLLGVYSDFLISKKLVLSESAEMLYLKVNNFTGSILDVNLAVEHRTFKRLAFGLGINLSRLNISAKGKDYPEVNFFGSIKMEYNGAFIFAKLYL